MATNQRSTLLLSSDAFTGRAYSKPPVTSYPSTEDRRQPIQISNIEVRIAGSIKEYEEAFRVVYQGYRTVNWIPENPKRIRAAPAQTSKDTIILNAYLNEQCVGTLSLYKDGKNGIPFDPYFPEQINMLRKQRRKIFEIGTFSAPIRSRKGGIAVCLELFRHAWLYVRHNAKSDAMMVFVSPRHSFFYQKLMGFRCIGPDIFYQGNGLTIPEIRPLMLDLNTAPTDFKNRFDHYGDSPRNLYRRLAITDRDETIKKLQLGMEQRKSIDWESLKDTYGSKGIQKN